MGKTNRERARQLLWLIDMRSKRALTKSFTDDDAEIAENTVTKYIDKAEKRGARKEREKATSEVCIYCPGLNDGSCPHTREGPSGWLCNGAFIPNDAHYRSTGKPYDIELTRDGAKVTARVWDMPEEVRGKLNLIEDNKHYRISSANMPSINEYEKVLWIRGTCTLEDNGTMRNIFSSTTDARDYLQHITALIDRLNAEYKPQFDTEEATKQILELKREIEQAELTIDTLKQAMYVKDCEIIRLEQELCVRPPLDTEKVKEKIETLREFSCLFGQFYNRPSHWKFDYYQEEVRKAVKHLLTALGLEPDA